MGKVTECTEDCASANGCRFGGVRCVECGEWFCAYELDMDEYGEGLCSKCAEMLKAEARDDERGWDELFEGWH